MSERISEGFKQIYRSTLDFMASAKNPLKYKTFENDSVEKRPERTEESRSESKANLIDIDSLMAQKIVPEKDELFEVTLIDVFRQEGLEGDQLLGKQTVLRQLLLSNKLELLPDMNPSNLLTGEELDLLLKRFRPHNLLVISQVWPQLRTKICEVLLSLPFLWFVTDSSKGRFASHEDCCDLCDTITDLNQSCIQVIDNQSLAPVFTAFAQISDVFSSLKCLRLFRFVISQETDELMAKMCPNLLHLDLTECTINYWEQLSAQHKRLRHLILSSTRITDQIFSDIVKNKTHLRSISVNSTNITGKDFPLLQKECERVDTRCCHQLSPNYIIDLTKIGIPFNQLKYLRLEVVFDDNAFTYMCRSINQLVLLELRASNRRNMRFFTTEGLKQISKLSNLRSLKLGQNLAVRPIPLMDIFLGCPLITSFALDGSDCSVVIEGEVMSKMADYWPLVKRLEFKSVDCITDKTMEGLSHLSDLSYLDLTECAAIDDYSIVYNLPKMSKLCYLVVDKCYRLTGLTYNAVLERAQSMDSVLSVSMFRCNYFIDYIKAEQLPKNLRLTFCSTKSKRFMTFDGNRVKILRCEDIHQYFNGK